MDLTSYIAYMDLERPKLHDESDSLMETVRSINNCDNEMLNVKKIAVGTNTAGNPIYELVTPHNWGYLLNKYDVEHAKNLTNQYDLLHTRHKLLKELRRMYTINDENSVRVKTTVLSSRNKRRLESEVCGICCDTHTIKHLVTTNCGHVFGKKCISQFLKHVYLEEKKSYEKDNDEIICPCCRNNCVVLTRYV